MLQYWSAYKHYNMQLWAAELIVIVTIYILLNYCKIFRLADVTNRCKPAVWCEWNLKSLRYYFYVDILTESDWLRAGRSGDRIPVGARFSAPVQTGPGAHPASCTMSTGSWPRLKSGRGVRLTPHHLIVPWSWKGRAIPLLSLWTLRPVQNLNACTGWPLFYVLLY